MSWARSCSGPASQRAASSIASNRARDVLDQLLPIGVGVLGEHGGGVHQVADALRGPGRRGAAVPFQQPAQAAAQGALHRGRGDLDRLALVDQRPVVGERPQAPPLVGVGAGHAGGASLASSAAAARRRLGVWSTPTTTVRSSATSPARVSARGARPTGSSPSARVVSRPPASACRWIDAAAPVATGGHARASPSAVGTRSRRPWRRSSRSGAASVSRGRAGRARRVGRGGRRSGVAGSGSAGGLSVGGGARAGGSGRPARSRKRLGCSSPSEPPDAGRGDRGDDQPRRARVVAT